MNKITKILISTATAIIALGSFASVAFATTPLSVTFTPNPLFVKPSFLPLDETSGVVTIANGSGTEQTILTEAINVLDDNNFGSLLRLKIVGSDGALFDNSLAYFFTTAGEFPLGTISNGQSKTFTYTISFINSNDNSYQGKTLGFDVCVGFQGGQTHCGNTVVGGEGDTGGDAGSTGNGSNGGTVSGTGGSSGGSHQLIIFNEKATNINSIDGSAVITWDTNLLSTSQVVYGLASGSYILNLTPPNFGYPLYNTEDSTKVISHSMLLTGLTPGQTYKYRVVSRASPPTISYEHQFTMPLPSGNESVITAGPLGVSGGVRGEILGASSGSTDGNATSSGDVLGNNGTTSAFDVSNLASVVSSGLGNILSRCSLIALLILLIGYLIWRFALRPRYEKMGLPEEKIKQKFFAFFGIFSALAIVVAYVFGQYCPIPIFLIALLLSAGLYVFNLVK